ncbi:MAG: galactose-1-phosphate uridylyltransferase [Woeseiaceae bacterium]
MTSGRHSHSRRNLLTDEWVLVSPDRTERPWQGQVERIDGKPDSEYESDCYLCPGNQRANKNTNPDYRGPYVFDNDYAALTRDGDALPPTNPLFESRAESGRCRVVCYSHRHDERLGTMNVADIARAIEMLTQEFVTLDADDAVRYVQIFENRGRMMGCSNSHPHAQIWATEHLPVEPAKELRTQLSWWNDNQRLLLADYRQAEIDAGRRIVLENEHFMALVPYWAIWPFETLLLPKRNFAAFDQMSPHEVTGLAQVLKSLLTVYDRLFDAPMPYSLGFHPRPSDGNAHPEWLFHAHINPPLLRSASVRKHLVGFEMFGMPQRDLTPEVAAERLRSV